MITSGDAVRKIAAEIEKNMQNHIGQLQLLEQFDELPIEYCNQMIQKLASFHHPAIARFLHMIQDEYEQEYQEALAWALKKLHMAGVNIEKEPWFTGKFQKAFCTRTRDMGTVSINVFWKVAPEQYTAECFLLNFDGEGISNFALVENVNETDFPFPDMVRLRLKEFQLLLTMAHARNQKRLVRPSLGYFLYRRNILPQNKIPLLEYRDVIVKVSSALYDERSMIHSLFLALKNQDEDYAISLFDWQTLPPEQALAPFAILKQPGVLFLEGKVDHTEKNEWVCIEGHLLLSIQQKIWRYAYSFGVAWHEQNQQRLIHQVKAFPPREEKLSVRENPLQKKIYVRVYQIVDMEALLNLIDELEQVQKVDELPYGLHLRICTVDDVCFQEGISMTSGVVADLMVSGEEFVVLADQQSITMEFDGNFAECLCFKKTYEISLHTAIHYYQGQYRYFEDVLDVPKDSFLQDPMRFLTACYTLSEPERFRSFIRQQHTVQFALPDEGKMLYYCLQKQDDVSSFATEYIFDENYLAVSAFGEAALEEARRKTEASLPGVLKFEHLEVNPHGFFEMLTPRTRERYPQMEKIMQNIYLEKWKVSASAFLQGMSPLEAYKTKKGKQLLWKLFKWMHLKPQWFDAGHYADIPMQAFVDCLEKENSDSESRS